MAAGVVAAKLPDEEEVAAGAATEEGIDAPVSSRRPDVVKTAEAGVTIILQV